MKIRIPGAAVIVAVGACYQSSAVAEDAPAKSQVVALVERMGQFLDAQKSFSLHAVTSRDEQLAFGYKLQHNETTEITVQRPTGLRSEVKGDQGERQFYYDGENFTVFSPGLNYYATIPAPATLGELLRAVLSSDALDFPMIDFLYQGANNTLLERVESAVHVGESSIDGVACEHLAFRQANVDWQLWVAKGEQPLPRKFVITTRFEVGDPQFSALLTWNLAPKVDSKTFTFSAPQGATKIPYRISADASDAGAQ